MQINRGASQVIWFETILLSMVQKNIIPEDKKNIHALWSAIFTPNFKNELKIGVKLGMLYQVYLRIEKYKEEKNHQRCDATLAYNALLNIREMKEILYSSALVAVKVDNDCTTTNKHSCSWWNKDKNDKAYLVKLNRKINEHLAKIEFSVTPDGAKFGAIFKRYTNESNRAELLNCLENEIRNGYRTVLVYNGENANLKVEHDNIVLQFIGCGESQKLKAYWFCEDKFFYKSLPIKQVAHILNFLPQNNKTSSNIHLICAITEAYECDLLLDSEDNNFVQEIREYLTKNESEKNSNLRGYRVHTGFYSNASNWDPLSDVRQQFEAILKNLKSHHYVVYGGGVTIDNKIYSKSAAQVVNFLQCINFEDIDARHASYIVRMVRKSLEGKNVATFTFFGLCRSYGDRDPSTADLYNDILIRLNTIDWKLSGGSIKNLHAKYAYHGIHSRLHRK